MAPPFLADILTARPSAPAAVRGSMGFMASQLVRASATPRPVRRAAARDALAQAPWLACLSDAARERAVRAAAVRVASRGDVLFRAGQPLEDWHGVLRGFATLEHASGQPSLRTGLATGAWFGEHLLLTGEASACGAVARTCTVVASLPRRLFERLFADEPAFAQFIALAHAQRLSGTLERLQWPTRMSVDARAACAIACLFEPRAMFGGVHTVDATQTIVADFLRLSRQRTNAALNLLEREGELTLGYACIEVADPPRLRARALRGDFG